MAKSKQKTIYVCENCGQRENKWLGRCPKCGEWNTFEEEQVVASTSKALKTATRSAGPSQVKSLKSIDISSQERFKSGSDEFDLVLGGGFVPGQVVLFSGEPGIGKSTLLLQTTVQASVAGLSPLYVSAEESESQVAGRAARLFPDSNVYADVDFIAANSLDIIVANLESRKHNFVVLDSIQTIYDPNLASLPGSLTQIKACSSALIEVAKRENIILILVGHINKDGNIAGPKVLEHLVDAVLQLEGERSGEYRILRSLKNRFGPTGEVGLFSMEEGGLTDMLESSGVLGGGVDSAVGTAKTVSLEGNRAILLEVQALTNETVFAYPKRVAEGISVSKLQLICAILDRFAGAKLGSKDVYVRTAGGYKLQSPIADLAIAAAILSSLKKKTLNAKSIYTGELSLSGKVYLSSQQLAKLRSISKYGIREIFLPDTSDLTVLKKLKQNTITGLKELV